MNLIFKTFRPNYDMNFFSKRKFYENLFMQPPNFFSDVLNTKYGIYTSEWAWRSQRPLGRLNLFCVKQ